MAGHVDLDSPLFDPDLPFSSCCAGLLASRFTKSAASKAFLTGLAVMRKSWPSIAVGKSETEAVLCQLTSHLVSQRVGEATDSDFLHGAEHVV